MSKRFSFAFENAEVLAPGETPEAGEQPEPLEIEVDMAQEDMDERAEGEEAGTDDASAGPDIMGEIQNAIAIEEALTELADELSDNDRVIEVTDGLTDIQDIVSSTPDGETVDIPMLQTAANMAVAGTDADAQSIIPAIEAFSDKKVALEAIGEKINSALESVLKGLTEIKTKSMALIARIFKQISFFEKELLKREAAIKELGTDKISFKMKLSKSLIKSHNEYVKDGQDYVKSLKSSVAFYKSFSSAMVDNLGKFDTMGMDWLKSIGNSDKAVERDSKYYDMYFDTFNGAVAKVAGVVKQAGTEGTSVMLSPELLCGFKMKATGPNTKPQFDGSTPAQRRDAVSSVRIDFVSSGMTADQKQVKNAGRLDFEMTKAELLAIVAQGKELLENSKKFLDARYKTFKLHSVIGYGPKTTTTFNLVPKYMPTTLNFRIMNRAAVMGLAMNHNLQKYTTALFSSAFAVIDAAVRAQKAEKPAAA